MKPVDRTFKHYTSFRASSTQLEPIAPGRSSKNVARRRPSIVVAETKLGRVGGVVLVDDGYHAQGKALHDGDFPEAVERQVGAWSRSCHMYCTYIGVVEKGPM